MNLKSITAQSVVALSLGSVCSMSQAGFLDNLFSSSTKEPVALSTTTQEIMKNHPVWVIDGKDTSAWSVVEGKKPRRGAAPLLLKQDRGDLGLIPAQTDAGYIATKTEKISPFLIRPASSSKRMAPLSLSSVQARAPSKSVSSFVPSTSAD